MIPLAATGATGWRTPSWYRLDQRPAAHVMGFLSLLALLWALVAYNNLVQLRVRADRAWSDIMVQLVRRYELIANLVEVVRGHVVQEQQVLTQVVEARARAATATGPAATEAAEKMLTGALTSFTAVLERYPQLRADRQFRDLQRSLALVEEALQHARRYYNAVVGAYNTKLAILPDGLIAKACGLLPKAFFQIDAATTVQTPQVSVAGAGT